MPSLNWIKRFRKRIPLFFSKLTPVKSLLCWAMVFNKFNACDFLHKLKGVYSQYLNFSTGNRLFNLNETECVTFQKIHKVLIEKWTKQVSKTTSTKIDNLTITCCIVNHLEQCIPRMMIFIIIHLKDHISSFFNAQKTNHPYTLRPTT